MTTLASNREIRLASRPRAIPTAATFALAESTLPPLQAGQVLVRNRFMWVDPYRRGRMNEGKSWLAPFAIGQELEGGAIGEVVGSRADGFMPGDVVPSRFGWRESFVVPASSVQPTSPTNIDPANPACREALLRHAGAPA